ncbi:hypothetical protein P7K49_027844 [Saguinus oedipus]|uniref:Uncharacterized protein n=1 Tax=Saguinus oedipus TaxID=9490 RepID=A0ABQ9UAN2_SAGOE|nr:hypothetical protein P7K49_027844 [Saguinus oedipus]
MILTMLLMLKLCTEVRVANELNARRRCFAERGEYVLLSASGESRPACSPMRGLGQFVSLWP